MQKPTEIRAELESLAPRLSQPLGNPPFQIPEDYFLANPLHILARVQSASATENTEADYFKTLPERILEKAKKEKPVSRKVFDFRNATWQLAAAALVLLMLGAVVFGVFQKPSVHQQLASLEKETVLHYIHNHLDEFDTELLENSIKLPATKTILSTNQISDDEISEYLSENGWQ